MYYIDMIEFYLLVKKMKFSGKLMIWKMNEVNNKLNLKR